MSHELLGRTLDGKFEIVEFLGRGKFGQVYRARQLAFGVPLRPVALKVFSRGQYATCVEEALKETAAVAALAQQQGRPEGRRYLIQIYDLCLIRDLDRPALVMELAEGGSLRGLITRRRPLPVKQCFEFMCQISQGISVLHSLEPPYVHRDIKSENVLLTAAGEVRIADFGLARMVEPLLQHSTAAGDYSCQPPEALLEGVYTPASDVWAMGLVFYEMLTGRNPFAGLASGFGREELAWRHYEARRDPRYLRPPSEECVELRDHPALEAVVMKCLAFSPKDRYADARQVLEELQRCAEARPPRAVRELSTRERAADAVAEARYLLRIGRREEAAALLAKARAADPGNSEICAELCEAYLGLGRAGEALRLALEGLQKARCRRLYLAAAKSYEALGNASLAKAFYREAERCGKGG